MCFVNCLELRFVCELKKSMMLEDRKSWKKLEGFMYLERLDPITPRNVTAARI